ncbi:beta-lactamase/transpeptidase-like protein [Xylariomycetidae sp. FL0641]|nr:beta-lactamase/transpeptidase-like protein [Xylariomycetidae sp. FL0641]
MILASKVVSAIAGVLSVCLAAPTCPLEGPVFPKPARLAESEAVKAAVSNLTATLEGIRADAQNYSFALEVFSPSVASPLFSVLHTAPKLATQNTTGVREVGPETVFRLGSLTKIYTIYLFLINAGDGVWNEPITKYVPELEALANRSDPVAYVAWDDVTIGGLATQMTGIPRDYALLGELTQAPGTKDQVLEYGFPPLTTEERPPCGDYPTCDRKQFFTGIALFYPSLVPFQTPAYSNVAFQLLGYALETITGKTFEQLLQETLVEPLGLNSTYLRAPEESKGVLPRSPAAAGWTFDLGESAAAGNMYSSVSDVSAVGRAIMSYKLLNPVTTRRWLKPFSFSTDPHASVGVPWGARRINLGAQPYRWVTAFNKAGRIGDYSSVMAIIPDLDLGVSVLLAGDLPANANFHLLDVVGDVMLPAVEEAARAEAGVKYGGHYVFANTTLLNSSMTIQTDDQPGLGVSQWYSNGTDFKWIGTVLQNGYTPVNPRIRLYPTGLEGPAADGGKRVVFKAIFEDADAPSQAEAMFSTDCATWINVESVIYGSAAMDELIFNVDPNGVVTSITSPSLRVTLDRQ